jgi:hypothetical protein
VTRRRPTYLELSNDPELAVLAALDRLLELSVAALLAKHPDLGVEEPEPHRLTAHAGSIIEASSHLQALLKGYRAALARHYRDIPSDLPGPPEHASAGSAGEHPATRRNPVGPGT